MEGEREGEKYQGVVASCTSPAGDLASNQACALTGNQMSDLWFTLNPLSHTNQGSFLLDIVIIVIQKWEINYKKDSN